MFKNNHMMFITTLPMDQSIQDDMLSIVSGGIQITDIRDYLLSQYRGVVVDSHGWRNAIIGEGSLGKYELTHFIKNTVSNYLAEMMRDPELRTAIIRNSHILESFQANVFRHFKDVNLSRDVDGNLFTKKELRRFVRFKDDAKHYLASAAIHGDREAINLGQSLKGNESYQGMAGVMSLMHQLKVEPHESLNLANEVLLTPSGYMKTVVSLQDEHLKNFLEMDFREELLIGNANLIFESLFRKAIYRLDEPFMGLLTHLVKEGGDWYMGLMSVADSPFSRLDLVGRKRDPVEELKTLFKHKELNPTTAGLIFRAQPKEVKVALCKTPAMANKIFKFTGDEDLRPLITKKLLRNTLASDLGI